MTNNTKCYSCYNCYWCASCTNCYNCYNGYYNCNCNHCYHCNYCNYCSNLKMTEHNYFCRSEKCNSPTSFQQPRYRVFNVEVGKDDYMKIKKICHELEFEISDEYGFRYQNAFKRMWDKLTQEEKQEYYDIPHFNRE